MPITFSYAARSDVGMVRKDNQDSGYAGPRLLVVADGMGGHAGGDIASSTVISEVVDLDSDAVSAGEAPRRLGEALSRANSEIAGLIDATPELEGMGTTVTALMRSRNKLFLAHIGDSRAYLARGGRVTQITRDHSFVQTLIDEGRITEEEASTHPQRSVVTRVLTGTDGDEPDIGAREAQVGDRYLLCSDGLSGFVAADTIAEIVSDGRSPAETADELVALALKAGAPDNVTVVVGDVVDGTNGSTQPQIVGAAELRHRRKRPVADSPAARAAALTRNEDDGVELAEEGEGSRGGRWLKRLGALAVVLLLLGGIAYAGYAWTQQQYYIGEQDGRVTVYQGIANDLGPLTLSEPVDQTDIQVSDLPRFHQESVRQTISYDSREDAEERVTSLRVSAQQCVGLREAGEECGG
ncbi:protein phosphatase 2C domain-containing protein [Janibacter alkaliphilus]|uniref:Protein phosphatase n=1 Tax=Janibacter alkaliphilus TaxID=1069963 RepID=A0A852X2D6_9MICO|nr:Stp1/IreP family PP2C-type Ser/Thr phosphatase [Janibacter alkaliphilus]NYG36598.1 protein phosphatase [Janibacter alkaliphilus]